MNAIVKPNNKNRVFNLKLYFDMLRQLKLIGFILGAITLIITVLPPLVILLRDTGGTERAINTPSINGVTPVLWGYMFVGGAGLIYTAFSFLNKRNASDFYHSLPNTSLCIYLSLTAAVITWLMATIVVNILAAYFMYMIIGVSINAIYLPYLFGYFMIGTLLVASAASIAVCITGTKLTNLVMTFLILFVPRFISMLLNISIVENTAIIPFDQTGIIFNPFYNIAATPFSLISSVTSGSRYSPIEFLPGMLYSGILALLYFSFALLLYRVRRSETAGMSAPSRLLQHIYRCAITLPLLVIIPSAAFSGRVSMTRLISDTPSILVVILSFSVIIYFTYELVTTKKFKNLLTSIPLFLALIIVVPIITYYGTFAASHAMLHNIPTESSVKSINELQNAEYGRPNYKTLLFAEIDHTNPKLISIILKALERTVDNVELGTHNLGNAVKQIKINYGISSITRSIYFTESEYNRVNELIISNEEYVKAAKQSLPLDREISSISLGHNTVDPKASDVWAIYKDEINSATPEKIQKALVDDTYSAANLFINVTGSHKLSTFSDMYPLNSQTPRTAKAFFGYHADKNGNEYNKLISDIMKNKDAFDYADFSIHILNPGEKYGGELWFKSSSFGESIVIIESETGDYMNKQTEGLSIIKLFSEHTSGNKPEDCDIDSSFAYISYSYRQSGNNSRGNGAIYIPMTSQQLSAFATAVTELQSVKY